MLITDLALGNTNKGKMLVNMDIEFVLIKSSSSVLCTLNVL